MEGKEGKETYLSQFIELQGKSKSGFVRMSFFIVVIKHVIGC